MSIKSNLNAQLFFALICLLISMLLLSFAAVPIYNLFCKATGFGGTTQRITSSLNGSGKGTRQIQIELDANVEHHLLWRFVAKHRRVTVLPGENTLIFYQAENLTDKDIIGTAVYNVTPLKAGKYFVKIHCFCFEEQLLKAGQKLLMPVSFFIDPAIENDPQMHDVDRITLSYSFFKVREVPKVK